METVAIILALIGTSGMLAYLGSQFKSSSEGGSKYASVMKILFNATSFTMLLSVPVAGMAIADSISIEGLQEIMTLALIPVVFLYIVFVFYLIWEYLSGLINVVSGGDRIESEQVT
jgi:hypothetical protein